MRASELLGRPVRDPSGHVVGVVNDLRCIQDGPVRGSMAAPRLHFLIVSRRRTGSLLGYDRREQQGPWIIRVVVRWLHRAVMVVPWEDVELRPDGFYLRAGGR